MAIEDYSRRDELVFWVALPIAGYLLLPPVVFAVAAAVSAICLYKTCRWPLIVAVVLMAATVLAYG